MPKRRVPKPRLQKFLYETTPVACKAGPGTIDEELWADASGNIAKYNLAFINHFLYTSDNGRVLGYDNGHGGHHRHFEGAVESFVFTEYKTLLSRFLAEVDKLKNEDEMKIAVRTDGFEGYKKRALERARKIDAGEKLTPSRTITFESPKALLEALSAEGVHLDEIAPTGTFTISSLAAALGRDPKSVRRDVLSAVRTGAPKTRDEKNPSHGQARTVEPAAKNLELRDTL
jgi:predicted transcriptional regulator